jgi:SAM-dependent methyltransferase
MHPPGCSTSPAPASAWPPSSPTRSLALPLADATADAVILAYVLFHLTDPPRALAEARRVLRPGGRVAAIT